MLKGFLLRIDEIDNRDTLYGLMNRHYDRVDRDSFDADLNEKDGAIVLKDDLDEVRGFSTYRFIATKFAGRRIKVLFSGDTIIDRAFWGDSALFRTFGKLLYSTMDNDADLYWFLISKGVRTYQMLPLFFKRFYPSVTEETPDEIDKLIQYLVELKYPGSYDRGVIKTDTYSLKESMADIPANKSMNRHVRFFLEKNPGWRTGDELACLTELNEENMKNGALKMLRDWDH